ncbi:DsbA family protein [Parasphingorhabdus cellanae]|uniref:DsbA family protein n=1 Tax=Parasphingorhabdus cellanae TaxID=2806553 RepID=A0ABX7T096_9SPHN|nr:DsbA family protein [Parasphingorhabdus cellanae]QTD54968.1 DsbA family protein [Parasphingorhabdus cellanae]
MLTLYIDFKSAASYLALEPTLELARETGISIDWRPFSVRPFSVPVEQDEETVGERHRRVRAAAQRDVHLHYAAVQGRNMHFADTPAGSDAALAALAVMEGDPVPFIRAAFTAYWSKQADLADEAVVETLLRSVGIDGPDWQKAKAEMASIRSKAEESGIFETPSYLIADQLFLGREHLPWIRSLIAAEQGD